MKQSDPKSPLAGFACRDRRSSMVLGEHPNGRIVHVSEVASGLGCGCTCPGCGARLVARKGQVNEHHFGHEVPPDGIPCRTGPETALHKLAKQVLAEQLVLRLPKLELVDAGERWIGFAGGDYAFDEALVEMRLGGIVPDVLVRKGVRDLLVEFAVTHPCGPEKLETIRQRDIAAVEIDLSGLPRDVNRAGIATAILQEAPRCWLHNPRSERGKAELERRRRAREEAFDRKIRSLAEVYDRAARACLSMQPKEPALTRLAAYGCGAVLGIPVFGAGCFTRAAADWQALCLEALLATRQPLNAIRLRDQLEKAGHIRHEFLGLRKEDAQALVRTCPGFASPYEAVRDWAEAAVERGVLNRYGRVGWVAANEEVERITAIHRLREKPKLRRREIGECVGRLLDGLPKSETEAFDFSTWMRTPLPGRSHSPEDSLVSDDENYAALLAWLAALPGRIASRAAAEMDLLGLPFEGARDRRLAEIAVDEDRREAERQAKAVRAADGRERDLRRFLLDEVGFEAESWMATFDSDLGCAPATAARSGPEGLARAVEAARERRRRDVAAARDRQYAEAARAGIRSAAMKVMSGDKLELFLRSAHPRLGGLSPTEYCTNQPRLDRCVAATLSGGRKVR